MEKVHQAWQVLSILPAKSPCTFGELREKMDTLQRAARTYRTMAENSCSYERYDTPAYGAKMDTIWKKAQCLAVDFSVYTGGTFTLNGDPRGAVVHVTVNGRSFFFG